MKVIKDRKEKFIYSLSVNLFFAFTLIVFGPYEVFISNTNDFHFTLPDFGWMLIAVGVLYLIAATFFLTILPKIWSDIINTLIFAFTICCYIQAMLLNRQMKVMIGEQISWSIQTKLINAFIWICIFIIIFVIKHFSAGKWRQIFQFLSAALTAMQFVALVSLLFTTNALTEEKVGYVSSEGMLDLSQNENVVVFILDYFDGRTMDAILSENPDLLEDFKGFTYFPNATSVHSRTYPSVTYLLTGDMCYFDQEPLTYVNNAYENSRFLPVLYEDGIDIGLYTFDSYIGNSVKDQMVNYVSVKLPVKFGKVVKYMAQIVLYRDMPYCAKELFAYDVNDMNNNIFKQSWKESVNEAAESENMVSPYRNFNDEWFHDTLSEHGLSLADTEGNFRFYHLASCHADLSDPIPYGIRSLEIVNEYLDQMRELNIYEDSTIIITSDHGSSGSGSTLDLPQGTAVPLLLAKPAGLTDQPVRISNSPVSHTDLIPTILNGFSLAYDAYGSTFFDITENDDRIRFYYYSALYSDEEGEIELREYEVDGDARESGNYHFTGNKWPILKSQNKVAE